jgi:hypothetical protein
VWLIAAASLRFGFGCRTIIRERTLPHRLIMRSINLSGFDQMLEEY